MIPNADATSPKVPVKRLEADDDCLNKVSMSFGENIQNGINLNKSCLKLSENNFDDFTRKRKKPQRDCST